LLIKTWLPLLARMDKSIIFKFRTGAITKCILYLETFNIRRKFSGGATLWQSSANALPLCCHALPVALPVFYNNKTKTMPITGLCYYQNPESV